MNYLSNIFNTGISPNLTLTEKRAIRFTNFSIVFGLCFCILSFLVNLSLMGWQGSIVPVVFFFLFSLGFYFQIKHQFKITKFFTLSIALFGVVVSCWLFSVKGYPYYMFLLTFSVGLVFYPKKKQQLHLLLLHLFCLGIALGLAPYIPPVLEIPKPELFSLLTFLFVLILLFLIIRTFTSENQIFEDKTNCLLASLQAQKDQIEKQSIALKAANDRLQQEINHKNIIQEQLAASNEELKRFVYVASHDLKEPLRSIGGFTQLIHREIKGEMNGTTKEYFNFVTDGVKRMGNLLDDLLSYSKVTRTEAFEKESINLNKIMVIIQNNLHHLILKNEGLLVIEKELPNIYGNTTQITQLFQNLISNAVKFKGENAPVIHIGFEIKPTEFIFSVKDNGIGIPSDQQNKIFTAFQRLHKSTYEGTGIGLAICEKVVTNHQGKIWLSSEVGVGTTFYFSIAKKELMKGDKSEILTAILETA